MTNKQLIQKLNTDGILSKDEFVCLLSSYSKEDAEYSKARARET